MCKVIRNDVTKKIPTWFFQLEIVYIDKKYTSYGKTIISSESSLKNKLWSVRDGRTWLVGWDTDDLCTEFDEMINYFYQYNNFQRSFV